jgi:hypothetical protein
MFRVVRVKRRLESTIITLKRHRARGQFSFCPAHFNFFHHDLNFLAELDSTCLLTLTTPNSLYSLYFITYILVHCVLRVKNQGLEGGLRVSMAGCIQTPGTSSVKPLIFTTISICTYWKINSFCCHLNL